MKKKKFSRMKINRLIIKTAILTIAFFSLAACEDDFNDVGSSIVDNNNFDALLYDNTVLNAHSEKIESVQSNGLSSYALGIYEDAKYGKTTANVLTQLKLSKENPSFGVNPELDSVVLTLPYFATVKEQTFNSKTYKLDSVYGNTSIKLSIFRSNYFLRAFDPNDDFKPQAYYSDQGDQFEQNLEGTPIYTTNSFNPSPDEITLPKYNNQTEETDTTRVSPRLRVKLPMEMFQDLIIDNEGSDKLLTNANFQNFFRGIYFKTELMENKGVMSLLRFNAEDAGITLYYRSEFEDVDGETVQNHNTFQLNFGDQIVNVFDTEYDQLPAQDGNLYLKGGEGSMAVFNLFTDQNQLDSLRDVGWLINEANLKLYVNKNELPQNQNQPERLFIYDIKNKIILKDYVLDGDVKENDVVNSRLVHLGRLSTDKNGNQYYKIRVTNYVNDIINNDSTNTKLGVVVSQNVNINTQSKVDVGNDDVSTIPTSEVVAPNGTVIYGTNGPMDKALKLDIYYTESKSN